MRNLPSPSLARSLVMVPSLSPLSRGRSRWLISTSQAARARLPFAVPFLAVDAPLRLPDTGNSSLDCTYSGSESAMAMATCGG